MALLHEATISPRKDELIEPWLTTRTWWDGVSERGPVGAFRLDDPAGQVGIECFLFGSESGSTLFVPVTYRDAALAGAESGLIGTMQHSVLGARHVYDAAADPVFLATVLDTIRTGGREAELLIRRADGTSFVREPAVTAWGEGGSTVASHDAGRLVSTTEGPDRTHIVGDGVELTLMRRLGESPAGPALLASFEGGSDLRLAVVSA